VLDDTVGDLAHRAAQVHRGLLDPAERLGLGEPELLLEDPLGPVDGLAGGQLVAEVGQLRLQGVQLGEATDRDLDRRHQVRSGERLGQVGHRAGVARTLDELALGEGRQDHHRGDPGPGDPLRRRDPVQHGHLDVQDDQVGAVLLGQLDGPRAVGRLPHDVVPLLGEHLGEVHPDQSLVLGDHDPGTHGPAGGTQGFCIGHGRKASGGSGGSGGTGRRPRPVARTGR
jgi:hypothetical protein